jgi:hypothetical protein
MSTFVLFDTSTQKLHRKRGHYSDVSYDSYNVAKAQATRLNNKVGTKLPQPVFVAMSFDEYRREHPVKMVTRRNLMSGLEFQEAEDTPGFCSPASEAYWSM